MKKPLFLIIGLLLITSVAVGAAKAYLYGEYEGYEIVKVFVDGQEMKGVLPAIIINGQVMIPADGVAQAFNKQLVWNDPMRFLSINTVPNTQVTSPHQPGQVTNSGSHSQGGLLPPTPELRKLEPFSLKGMQENAQYAVKAVELLQDTTKNFDILVQAEYYGWNRTTLQDQMQHELANWQGNIEYTEEFFDEYSSEIKKVLRDGSSKRSDRYYRRAMDRLDDGISELKKGLDRKERAYRYLLEWKEDQTTANLKDFRDEDEKANRYLRDAKNDLTYFQEAMEEFVENYLDEGKRRR